MSARRATLDKVSKLALTGGIQVWQVHLESWRDAFAELWPTLSPDEQKRARAFFFERDRIRFVTCRGLLRALVGRYLRQEPGALQFGYGPNGKPALKRPASMHLEFNLSHADELALFAVSLERRVGVDVERVRQDVDPLELGPTVFSDAEMRELRALENGRRIEAFFTAWTRKEALIKATGQGMSAPLREITVGMRPAEPGIAPLQHEGGIPGAWSLMTLSAPPEYKAAVAVEGWVSTRVVRQVTLDAPEVKQPPGMIQ